MLRIRKLPTGRRGAWLLIIFFALPLACLALTGVAESRESDGRFVVKDWARRYQGGVAEAIAVDGQGNVFVAGTSSPVYSDDILTIKYSPDGRRLWTRRYHSPDSYYNYATSLAVDGQGNVYIAGYSRIGWTSQEVSFATIKYDGDGQLLWERFYAGPLGLGARAYAMALDSQGNVYVTGESFGGDTGWDYATIKYSPEGEKLWVRRYNGPGNQYDCPRALAVDGQGNVIVTGDSIGSNSDYDYATVKYSPEGEKLWVRRYNGLVNALTVDAQGNVLVIGDYATIKYSPGGKRLWVRRYRLGRYSRTGAMAVDAQGNVYVTGTSEGAGYENDFATIKYSPGGKRLWVRRYNGPGNSWDSPSAMALDSQGNIYVTGSSYGGDTGWDYATIKYSPDGRRLWVRRYNMRNLDFPTAIAVDGQANVYVTGYSADDLEIWDFDFLTIKYRQNP